jgi:uncharacterized membrane protein YeaQ/YmgE (transglycosylase-associated protein family)
MPFLFWTVLGLIAGFACSRFVYKTGEGRSIDIAVGVAGAIVGGLLFNAARAPVAVGVNPWSLSVSAVGSVVVLWVWHAFIRRA